MNAPVQRRPHEARVIAEKNELETRIFALEQFFDSEFFAKVDAAEQERLKRQAKVMNEYAEILKERIDAFPPVIGVLPVAVAGTTDACKANVVSGDNPGPRGHEQMIPVTEQVEDLDGFAMMIDQWHGQTMERGNRMLNIPEGTEVTLEDIKNPGHETVMVLDGAYMQTYRLGALTIMNLFKDLPFGVSIEDAPGGDDAGSNVDVDLAEQPSTDEKPE